MKLKNSLQIVVLLAILVLAVFAFMRNEPVKIVYVNLDQLFNGFQMKKELESDFQSKTNQVQKELDHLKLKISIYKEKLETQLSKLYMDSLTSANARFAELSVLYEENYMTLKEQYDSQIQTQLQTYMLDFGKTKGYDLVITNLNGSTVIYGDNGVNVTEEALQFINQKYAGK